MGLFSKKPKERVVHPAVDRTIYVPAPSDFVFDHLDVYSSLFSPKRAEPNHLVVTRAGGWSAIRLPDAVHPWQLHNLAYWMLDCPEADDDVIAESGPSPHHPGYRLVRDPDLPDALCGWDHEGVGWTVGVPANDVVRGEDVPAARALSVPAGFHEPVQVTVMLEDPGAAMNPTNESNTKSRRHLERSSFDAAW